MRSRNRAWLAYKAEELKEFSSQQPFTVEASTNRWHSNCWPVFNEFRELFYPKGEKVVTPQVLDPLMDIGLAVWFGDNGKVDNDQVILNTHRFGRKGSRIVANYIKTCGLTAEVWLQKDKCRVRLDRLSSLKFLKTIGHRLPDFMHYKLSQFMS